MNCYLCDNKTSHSGVKDMLVCDCCGLYIKENLPSKADIKRYLRGFLLGTCTKPNPGASRINSANTQQLDVLKSYGVDVGKAYDVGASAGFFMKASNDRGWKCEGNDVSKASVDWGKKHYDLDIEYGFLEDLLLEVESYDLVVMWNTLEHTLNPKQTLDLAYSMLKTNGHVFIRVPEKGTVSQLKEFYESMHFIEFNTHCLSSHLELMGFEKVVVIPHEPDGKVWYTDYLFKKKEKV